MVIAEMRKELEKERSKSAELERQLSDAKEGTLNSLGFGKLPKLPKRFLPNSRFLNE